MHFSRVHSGTAIALSLILQATWATAQPEAAEPAGTEEPNQEPPAPDGAAGSQDPGAWFRVDSDGLGLQLWVGTTNNIGGIDIATDVYVLDYEGTSFGEFDIGPSFSVGPASFIPMIGIGIDWTSQRFASLIAPQLFTIVDGDFPIYFESWIQFFINEPFVEGAGSSFYTRDFLLYKVTGDFHIGPQFETSLALNPSAEETLASLQLGGRINYNAHGDWQGLLGLYLGYELTEQGKASLDTGELDPNTNEPLVEAAPGVVGRITYLHNF